MSVCDDCPLDGWSHCPGEHSEQCLLDDVKLDALAPILRALPTASPEAVEVATKILQQPLDDDHKAGMEVISTILRGAQIFETNRMPGEFINWIVFPREREGR